MAKEKGLKFFVLRIDDGSSSFNLNGFKLCHMA
jgi:hypothetical protein